MARGRKKYQPNETDRRIAEALAQYGVPHEQIAARIGISRPILDQHYSEYMRKAEAAANNNIARTLYQQAVGNEEKGIAPNVSALIFWCKTRMGWRETQKMDLTSSDGSMSPANGTDAFNLSLLSPEQIRALRGIADEQEKGSD